MAPSNPSAYLFEVPGKHVSIYLSLDVVDRLQQDVMRGFGAVPKRGAEIGGILLGSSAQEADRLVVNVDEYEMLPIEYKRGPSYLFSQPDRESFEEALARLRASSPAPIGFFRSNTRDAVGIQAEDLEVLDQLFPDPTTVVLMIKPFGTRVSMATFLVRENGKFPEGAPEVEFPFRRKDLAPADDPGPKPSRAPDTPVIRTAPAPIADRPEPVRPPRSEISLVPYEPPRYEEPERVPSPAAIPAPAPARVAAPIAPSLPIAKSRGAWVWLPLSFIFLLLGVLLGFQAALTMRPQTASGGADPFNLLLTVSKEGDDLNVRWDRQAPAIRAARRGVLIIVDGSYNKTVELDASQLQTGSVVYRYNSSEVRFRFEVYPRDRDVLIESLDWSK